MRIGICLAGGGAKGSYEAGVIRALFDKSIEFTSVSGTSIGAVNGYYIYTNNVEKLSDMWTNIQKINIKGLKIKNNTVDNNIILNELSKLTNNNNSNINFYVNYIEVNNKKLNEKIVNVDNLRKEDQLNSIKYSSLLPFNPQSTLPFKYQFKKDLSEGLYDGFNLDGGLVNNELLLPLTKDNLDKIILISMKHDYILPEYIKNIYNEENIIVVRPKTIFEKNDTLRFEQEFCSRIYKEGYEIGQKLNI
mgnify:CR=1 FL=1